MELSGSENEDLGEFMFDSSTLDEVMGRFIEDGVSIIKGLFADRLELLVGALEAARLSPSPMASLQRDSQNEVVFFTDFFTYRKNQLIRDIVWDNEVVETVSQIVQSKSLRVFHDHILIKSGAAPETPWHQDRPYYLVDGPVSCSLWITPDRVPIQESLQFIRGSHAIGREFSPVSFRDGQVIDNRPQFEVLDDEKIRKLQQRGVLSFHMEPGDALLFDNRVLHKATRSNLPAARRALSIRYLGDGAQLTSNYVNATPPFDRMGLKVVDKGPLPEEWFPTVRYSA
jgi:ectoine hydroxylase-related dioxygenase (phytanoyl-CoA dioxygenase family)